MWGRWVERTPTADLARQAVAIALAVAAYGVTFGAMSRGADGSLAQTAALSLFTLNGASQIAFVSVLVAGGSQAAALAAGFLLATRNSFYGLTVSQLISGPRWRRLVAAHLVIDESTAMAASQPRGARAEAAFWLTGGAIFVGWNLGTLLGANFDGTTLSPEAIGLDVAFPAAFVALLAPHLRRRPGREAAATGASIAAVSLPLVPAGVPVLLATMAVGSAGRRRRSSRR